MKYTTCKYKLPLDKYTICGSELSENSFSVVSDDDTCEKCKEYIHEDSKEDTKSFEVEDGLIPIFKG